MLSKYKIVLASLAITLGIGFVFAVPTTGSALFEDATSEACKGVNLTNDSSVDEKCTKKAGNKVDKLIATIINVLSFVIGVIAVIVLIISGLRFILSSGDSNAVASARNGVIYAIVGLLVVVIAQTIVKFVISKFA